MRAGQYTHFDSEVIISEISYKPNARKALSSSDERRQDWLQCFRWPASSGVRYAEACSAASIPLRSILDRIALLIGRPVGLAGLADGVARYELRRATSDEAFAVAADLTALKATDAEFRTDNRTVPAVRLRPRVGAPTVHIRACD